MPNWHQNLKRPGVSTCSQENRAECILHEIPSGRNTEQMTTPKFVLTAPNHCIINGVLGPHHTLVTGAEGFIGRWVRSRLLSAGRNVISLDQKSNSTTPGIFYACDVTDPRQLQEIFRAHKLNSIVHLASLLPTASKQNPQAATQVNIAGTLNILEAARNFQVPRIVYASSLSVYGSSGASDTVSEISPTAPEDLYGAAKKYAEALGEAYACNHGIQFTALRISTVLGPGATGTASPWRSQLFDFLGDQRSCEISIPYRPDEILSMVHVEDLADVFAILLDAKQVAFSAYNVPSEIWQLSDLGKEIQVLNNNIRITFGDLRVTGFPRQISSDRFRTEFNYKPTSLKERLNRARQRTPA